MPRRPTEPDYDDDRSYPARGITEIGDLAEYLQAVANTYAEAARQATRQSPDGSSALDRVARRIRVGRQQAEQAHRLVTEFSLARDGGAQTQRTAARNLGISRSTAAYFHMHPLAEDELVGLDDD